MGILNVELKPHALNVFHDSMVLKNFKTLDLLNIMHKIVSIII